MPAFSYKGLSASGKTVRGVVEADNSKLAKARLKKEGVFVTEITDKKNLNKKSNSRAAAQGKVNIKEMALMTRQLSSLIKAQIPLVETLAAIVDQVENQTLKAALADIKSNVNEGISLHKAMAKYPKIFDNIYLSMVEAGEATGSLDVILMRLAEFTEKQNELKGKLFSAMMYPVMMIGMSVLIILGLFIYIVPQIASILEENGQELPTITKIIMATSRFMVDYWMIMILGTVGIVMAFLSWKATNAGQTKWDQMKMNLPIVGKLIRMVTVSRFCKTLSTLLAGGVPMLMAFDIVKNVVNNKIFEKIIMEARDNVSEGESIAGPLKKSGEFPPLVIHMIGIGEKTGELEAMLTQVSATYDFEVDNAVGGLTSVLGPIMIIVMGLIIGTIVISVIMPIMEMSSSFG